MNIQLLKQYIFNGSSRIYAILDGASIPDLRMKLYEMQPQYICLYRGDLEPDIAEIAPYLVRMVPTSEFTDWVLTEGWGNHWSIFVQSRYSLAVLQRHFRTFLTAYDESGEPLLFRYYDPRILRTFLPTCNNEELEAFFRIILNFVLEDDDPNVLLNYSLPNGELKVTAQSVE